MDKRNTLHKDETFLTVLADCKNSNSKVHLLYEEDGVIRGEGFVQKIEAGTDTPYLELTDGRQILLKNIIAVNGMFDPSYSEC